MKACVIRPMRLDDVHVVVGWIVATPLWQRYRLRESTVYVELEAALKRDELLLVADMDRSSMACGIAWCIMDGAFARSAYLRRFGVREEYGGRGIGTALLVETERRVSEVCDALFLLVSDFNTVAQRFYQRQGYRQIGAIPNYVLPDVTELIFWKRLRRAV